MGPIENQNDDGWNLIGQKQSMKFKKPRTDVDKSDDETGGRGREHVNNNISGGDHERECESEETRRAERTA